MERRTFLQLGLGTAALSLISCTDQLNSRDSWWAGDVAHILPLVSENAFNIKLSFAGALSNPPVLMVNGEAHEGQQQDSDGRFFAFRPDWPTFGSKHGFKPAAYRARLYDIILDQKPDLVVACGDHIYWDYRSWKENPDSVFLWRALSFYSCIFYDRRSRLFRQR